MSTAREIPLDEARAGMTLAADLLDAHGAVLLPRDAALTDAVLAALRRRGVERCVVAAADPAEDAADAAQRERERERQLAQLEHLFRNTTGPGSLELLARLRAYRGGGEAP